jgi:hypothetical protein
MVRILERLSLAAGPPANDDQAGGVGSPERGAAWVIDGATGLADESYVPGAASDAAWFAETLEQAMTRRAMLGGPIDRQLREAYGEAHAAFARLAPAGVPDYARPIATVLAVSWLVEDRGEVSLDYASLGDGTAIVAAHGLAPRVVGRARDEQGDRQVNEAVQRLQAAGTGDPDAVMAAMLDRLRQTRSRGVRRYAAFAEGCAEGAATLDREHLRLRPPGTLLLMTDGFYRLVDTYRAYSPASLLQAASLIGLAELGAELRRIEAADPVCKAHPRLKPRDDATAILLAL